MLISEFVENNELEFVENEEVKHLIEVCLEEIHGIYGFNQPEWTNEKYWMFDELERDLNQIESSPEMFGNVLNHINQSFYRMSDSVITDIAMGKSLFTYKEKPLYVRGGILRIHPQEEIYPYMVMIKPLLSIYKDTNPDVNIIINATRLDECSSKIRMMTSLNLLWLGERNRHINKSSTLDKKAIEFENRPVNKIRRDELSTFVYGVLLKDDSLTVDEIKKMISKNYEKRLLTLYNEDKITDDGENDVTKVSNSVLERWITEIRTDYLEN